MAHVLKNKALLSNRATAIATIGIKLGHLEASNPKFFAKSLKQWLNSLPRKVKKDFQETAEQLAGFDMEAAADFLEELISDDTPLPDLLGALRSSIQDPTERKRFGPFIRQRGWRIAS